MNRRAAVTAGLALTAPLALLGLVLLPVGMLMQVGTQSVLRVTNAGDRPLWITPVGTSRTDGRCAVLRQALSGLVPLPAFRGADLPLEPGAVRRIVYKAGEFRPSAVLARDASGDVRQAPLAPRTAELALGRFADLPPAPPDLASLARGSPQALPWAVVAAGLLGLGAFVQLLRLRRRWNSRP